MSILTGGSPFNDLIGIAAGHTYVFLKVTLPASHGYDLLCTPKLLEDYVNRLVRGSQQAQGRVFGLAGDRLNVNP
jgi:hypothetical protein